MCCINMFSRSNNLKTQISLLARYLRILNHLNTSKHYKKYSYYSITPNTVEFVYCGKMVELRNFERETKT